MGGWRIGMSRVDRRRSVSLLFIGVGGHCDSAMWVFAVDG